LARTSYLGRSTDILERAMTGDFVITPEGTMRHVADFVDFHDGAATFPWRSQAAWIAAQLARRFKLEPHAARDTAMGVFRSDIYRTALSGTGASLPSASVRVEGALLAPTAVPAAEGRLILSPDAFFDGEPFDPSV
jgi:NitT/TauT family transport system ATP-binding protein